MFLSKFRDLIDSRTPIHETICDVTAQNKALSPQFVICLVLTCDITFVIKHQNDRLANAMAHSPNQTNNIFLLVGQVTKYFGIFMTFKDFLTKLSKYESPNRFPNFP